MLSSLALIILLDKKPGFLEGAKEAFCAVDSERNISFNIDKHDNWKGNFLQPLLLGTIAELYNMCLRRMSFSGL